MVRRTGQQDSIMADGEVAVVTPAPMPTFNFAFLDFLKQEHQYGLDTHRPVCNAYRQGHCPLGKNCPDKHSGRNTFEGTLVCKHWLRGLCKRGEACVFLHEYNLRDKPECNDWAQSGRCRNGDDCLYQHPDPDAKRPPCPHFDRGFCPLGPRCGKRHIKRNNICHFYLAGFCPNGRTCAIGAHAVFKPWEELKPPEYKIIKSEEELEQERLEQEAEIEREEAAERERNPEGFGQRGGFRGGRGWQRRGGGQKRQRKY
jgi:cleavage and polyadenylation specificity factor subunit 4